MPYKGSDIKTVSDTVKGNSLLDRRVCVSVRVTHAEKKAFPVSESPQPTYFIITLVHVTLLHFQSTQKEVSYFVREICLTFIHSRIKSTYTLRQITFNHHGRKDN